MKLACAISAVAVLTAFTLGLPSVNAQAALKGEDASSPLGYSTLQHVTQNDSRQEIVQKASRVLPRQNQTDWMRLERTFFIHFGPNTFRGVEWGNGHEDPSVFNPTQLDADQWVRTVRDGGGKMVILVCKHHDGLNLWPTRYSDHSVAFSPWEGGKGNLVREVAAAARKYNIKLGVYLSPADLYQLKPIPQIQTATMAMKAQSCAPSSRQIRPLSKLIPRRVGNNLGALGALCIG